MPVTRKVHSGRTPESLRPKSMKSTADDQPKTTPVTETSEYFPDPSFGHLEYETSEAIDKLAKAFVAFRAACPNVVKDKEGYNYNYATLGNVIDHARDHLKKQGLAVMQFPIAGVKSLGVITVLLHESGQYIRSRFLIPIPTLSGTNVTQDGGAAITYARRYAMVALLGVAAEEDTDGVPVKRRG